MIDKRLEANIRKTKQFIELWDKFHTFFNKTICENCVSEENEKEFVSIRVLVNSRYEDLMDGLGVKPLKRFMINPSITSLLTLEKIGIMSDTKGKAVNDSWADSSGYLNLLLERLKRKKRRIEGFNRFFFVLKNGPVRFR
ncbi:MAG: hypothetical protein ABID09_05200 [Candidatus Omnitrophota bacterium]